MGWGGIIAGALGGGAQATVDLANGQIEDQRKKGLAAELSNIDEQRQMRVAEAQERIRQTGRVADSAFDARQGATDKAAALKTLAPVQAEAAGAQAGAIATATQKVEDAANNDPTHLAGLRKKTAATETAASRAQAALAGAQAKVLGVELDLKKITLQDATTLNGLYDEAIRLSADDKMDEATKAARMAKITQQVTLIKSKTGQAGAKDPEIDTTTREVTSIGPNGEQIKTTSKEARRPGKGGAAGDDPLGLRGGAPAPGPAAAPAPTPASPVTRPFMASPTKELEGLIAGRTRRISPEERARINDELEKRKQGDISSF